MYSLTFGAHLESFRGYLKSRKSMSNRNYILKDMYKIKMRQKLT